MGKLSGFYSGVLAFSSLTAVVSHALVGHPIWLTVVVLGAHPTSRRDLQ